MRQSDAASESGSVRPAQHPNVLHSRQLMRRRVAWPGVFRHL